MARGFDAEGKVAYGSCEKCMGALPAAGRRLCDFCERASSPQPGAVALRAATAARVGAASTRPRVVPSVVPAAAPATVSSVAPTMRAPLRGPRVAAGSRANASPRRSPAARVGSVAVGTVPSGESVPPRIVIDGPARSPAIVAPPLARETPRRAATVPRTPAYPECPAVVPPSIVPPRVVVTRVSTVVPSPVSAVPPVRPFVNATSPFHVRRRGVNATQPRAAAGVLTVVGAVLVVAVIAAKLVPNGGGGGETIPVRAAEQPPLHEVVAPRRTQASANESGGPRLGLARLDGEGRQKKAASPVPRRESMQEERTQRPPQPDPAIAARRVETVEVLGVLEQSEPVPPRPVSALRFPDSLRRLLAPWSKSSIRVTVLVATSGVPQVLSVSGDCPVTDFTRARLTEAVMGVPWRPGLNSRGEAETAGTGVVFEIP